MLTNRAHQEKEVLRDHLDLMGPEETRVMQDPVVHLELLDSKEHQDCRAHQDPKETRELQEEMEQ